MQDIIDYLKENLELTSAPSVYDYQHKDLSDFKLQRIQDMYTFGEWMYKDATIFLERKRKAYLEFKEYYNLN